MWICALIFSVGSLATYIYSLNRKIRNHIPANYPDAANCQQNKRIVVCAGDSITHGIVSYNYVDWLMQQPSLAGFQFFNAGINSDLTYTLLKRLDDIIAMQPDHVTVLIGTNDVNAVASPSALKRYYASGKIDPDVKPDLAGFQDAYRQIVQRLKTETIAEIAVASVPILGEDLTNKPNQLADKYSEFVKQLADEEEIEYLPIRERMKACLSESNVRPRHRYEQTPQLMISGIIQHNLLKKSWDSISRANGMAISYDNIHFNSVGAKLIGQTVQEFLTRSAIIK
ncbi:SGNH/GDSL hydrolase family protein [Spirosoma montaniterrae]|uniref:SGNH hydrolase-type esterase domain-containing protein n=1 Tax=Spirosoma montaniterrae TaxID=1178516 RepID=A0A1P9X1L7_9BACT|nr:SGNH/GDSL hydrolase family protein [Spirosoma montaniterrae]AQG81529.1 hypothetical protein AWR27_20760 [Spirosoma montaniterrae]